MFLQMKNRPSLQFIIGCSYVEHPKLVLYSKGVGENNLIYFYQHDCFIFIPFSLKGWRDEMFNHTQNNLYILGTG